MPLTTEERVTKVEETLVKHDARISACEKCDAEQEKTCTDKMAKFEIALTKALTEMTSVMNTNKTMIKVLVWTIITLITILGSLLGIKIADPGLLGGL